MRRLKIKDVDKEIELLWKYVIGGYILTFLIGLGVATHIIGYNTLPEPQNEPVSDETKFYVEWDPCGLESVICDGETN